VSELTYPRFWWLFGGVWVVLILVLSLANLSLPQVSGTWGDKLNHAIAYGFLTGWFGQLSRGIRAWLKIALLAVLFGALMEVLQGMLPHRWFDPYDALANSIGVTTAVLILLLGGDRVLVTVERLFKSLLQTVRR